MRNCEGMRRWEGTKFKSNLERSNSLCVSGSVSRRSACIQSPLFRLSPKSETAASQVRYRFYSVQFQCVSGQRNKKKASDADKSNSHRTAKGKYKLFSPFFRKTAYFFIGLLHWNVLVCQSLEKCNTLIKKGSPSLIYSPDSSNFPFTEYSISLSMFHFYSVCLSSCCQRKN